MMVMAITVGILSDHDEALAFHISSNDAFEFRWRNVC